MKHRDTVFVRGLEVRAVIGVEAWERREAQTLVLDLDVSCDASLAAARDDVKDAVNYRTLSKESLAFAEGSRFRLVETFAVRLVERLRRRHKLAWIRLRVAKPGAVRFSREVGVEVERGERP